MKSPKCRTEKGRKRGEGDQREKKWTIRPACEKGLRRRRFGPQEKKTQLIMSIIKRYNSGSRAERKAGNESLVIGPGALTDDGQQ